MLLDCNGCVEQHSYRVGPNTNTAVSESQSRFGRDDGQTFPCHCRDWNFCQKNFEVRCLEFFTVAKILDSAKDYINAIF